VLLNVERRYLAGGSRFLIVFRVAKGAIGPSGDVTHLLVFDQNKVVRQQPELLQTLTISGEVREEADNALRQLLDTMNFAGAGDIGEKQDVDHLFYRLTQELYLFCGFISPTPLPH
jgi:hypothetical protein